jgi:hypothetical protein
MFANTKRKLRPCFTEGKSSNHGEHGEDLGFSPCFSLWSLCPLSRNFFVHPGIGTGLGRWHEGHSEIACLALEHGEFTFLTAALELCRTSVHPSLSLGDEAVEETGQVARHGFNGFDPSQMTPDMKPNTITETWMLTDFGFKNWKP